jgi:hypothetical protein
VNRFCAEKDGDREAAIAQVAEEHKAELEELTSAHDVKVSLIA